jgi:hypothetical protein
MEKTYIRHHIRIAPSTKRKFWAQRLFLLEITSEKVGTLATAQILIFISSFDFLV